MSGTPYYSTRSATSDRPRLLLVSYHFPPRHSAGALRWRKLAPFLHDSGWDLDVLTTPPAGARLSDPALSELPPGVQLHAVEEKPGRLRRIEDSIAEWIRRRRRSSAAGSSSSVPGGESGSESGLVPTSQVSWVPRSLRDLVRIYKVLMTYEEVFSWAGSAERVASRLGADSYAGVLASSPPWATLIAGTHIATRYGLPLVLDFRDPWSLPQPRLVEKLAHPLALALADRLEASAVRAATAVVVNTPNVERAMVRRYPDARVRTILNGVDEVFPGQAPESSEPFRIVYAGTIYIDRDPRVLFEATGRMVAKLGLRPADLQVEFIGHVSHYEKTPTAQLARDAGIADHFVAVGPMPRDELLVRLRSASVLVSLPQSTPWSMPSKIYEYMSYDSQLLVFADERSATAEVLAESDAIVLDPGDSRGTEEALTRCYERHRSGAWANGQRNREIFARSRRGRELQALLQEIGLQVSEVGRGDPTGALAR